MMTIQEESFFCGCPEINLDAHSLVSLPQFYRIALKKTFRMCCAVEYDRPEQALARQISATAHLQHNLVIPSSGSLLFVYNQKHHAL